MSDHAFERFCSDCRVLARAFQGFDRRVHALHVTCCTFPDRVKACTYVDEQVEVVSQRDGLALSVERCANRNPVVVIDAEGRVVRSHGEWTLLREHVRSKALEVLGD